MSRLGAVAAALALCAGLCHADAPSDFTWRAPLELPAATSMARVSLPAQALVQLQSSDARDIRVFNGTGEAVAFAIMAPAQNPAGSRGHHAKLSGAAAVQHGARHPAAHGLDASPHPGGRAAFGLGAHERLASPGGPAA